MAIQEKTVATGDYAWKSWSNAYVISLTLRQEQTDAVANTSLVSYLFTISNTNNNRFIANDNSWTISIGGQDIAIYDLDFDLGTNFTTQTIAQGQVVVMHNADGTCHMPYDVSVPNIQSWNRYGPPAMSLSGTWELTAIPRASGISCPVGMIGKPVTISLHKAEPGTSHTITYQFGELEGTVVEDTQDTQIQWVIPKTFYNQIPNERRGEGTLTCRTYNGNTLAGEASCPLYAEIDEAGCQPVYYVQIEDENDETFSLTGDRNTLVRYYSDAKISATYLARQGAHITGYTMTHNGRVYTDDQVQINGVENGTFDFLITDSRCLSVKFSEVREVIPYVKLTCNLSGGMPDADGNMTLSVSGNFFHGSFGVQNNSLRVQYRYKSGGASWSDAGAWQTAIPVITENGYIAQVELSDLDYQKSYTFQARAIDALAKVHSTEYTARLMPVFDWGERDFSIHGDLQVDGDLSVGGSVWMGDTPVLSTPYVRTFFWHTSGGVSMQSVEDFLATCTSDCAFVTMIRGDAPPFVGMAIGAVYGSGKYGAVTLYDCLHGVQSRRVYDGVFYET